MYKAFLNRLSYGEKSTLGILTVYFGLTEVFKCFTLELPWKENKRKISCIPVGDYLVKYRKPVGKFNYPHYHVTDVESRDGILIHRGNFTSDIEGCILVGNQWSDLNKDNQTDIANSKVTLQRLYEILGDDDWILAVS